MNLGESKFSAAISSCATDGFRSFLKRWNPLIEDYNMSYLGIYHMARCVCVLENFNCMLLDG